MTIYAVLFSGNVIWTVLCLLGLFLFIRGFVRGLIYSAIDLTGLLIAAPVAWIAGWLIRWIVGGLLPWSPELTRLGAEMFVAAAILVLFFLLSNVFYGLLDEILTDNVLDVSASHIQFVLRAGGAIVEIIFGVILVWLASSVAAPLSTLTAGEMQKDNITTARAEDVMGQAKDTLEEKAKSEVGAIAQQICQPLAKLVLVSRDPQARARVAQYPGVEQLLSNPKILPILASPEINAMVTKKDYEAMVKNALVLDVATDFTLVLQLSSAELDKALNDLLTPTPPAPAKK